MLKNYWQKHCKINIAKIFFLLISLSIFNSCLSTDNYRQGKKVTAQLTKQEKKDLNDFFFNLLLKSPGIYVLHGSKPMSCHLILKYTPEEVQKICQQYQKNREPTWKDILSGLFSSKRRPFYSQQWQQVKDRIKMTNYLIVMLPELMLNDLVSQEIYFVNITNTIILLQKHYAFFKEIAGSDFDPLKMIYELENADSIFWQKVRSNYIALGLVFGFGEDNSRFFAYWSKGFDHRKDRALDYFHNAPFTSSEKHDSFLQRDLDYQHFFLPVFRHFENDPILEQYQKEREKIKKLYQGKDPLLVILQKLTEKKFTRM